MSVRLLFSSVLLAVAISSVGASSALACDGPTCNDSSASVPRVIYASPPLPPRPIVGYWLDPSDWRPDLYVVNEGPFYTGPNVIAVPRMTYSESGFAIARPFPYVRFYNYPHGYQGFAAPRPYARYSRNRPGRARVIEIR
jgi:hypothetical protein